MRDIRHLLEPGFYRQGEKPLGQVRLDRSHPLADGLDLFLMPSPVHGLRCLAHGDLPTVTGALKVGVIDGRYVVDTGSTSDNFYLDYPSRGSFSSACTVMCITRPADVGHYFTNNDGAFFSSRSSGNAGLSYYHDFAVGGSPNPGRQSFVIQGIAAYTPAGNYLSGGNYQAHGFVAESGGSVGYMADGVEQDTDAISSFTASTAPWRVGQFGSGSGLPLYSKIDVMLVWRDRALTAGEYLSVSKNPYQLLKPANDRVWVPASGGITLTVSSCTHALTSDTPSLTQANTLAVNDAAHVVSSDSPALAQANTLTVADAAHALTSDNVVLSFDALLVVQDGAHTVSSDAPTLIQANILVLADAAHALSSDNVTLTQAHVLAVQDALHALSSDAPALTQASVLVVSDALHALLSDNITLVDGAIVVDTPVGRVIVIDDEARVVVMAGAQRVVNMDAVERIVTIN